MSTENFIVGQSITIPREQFGPIELKTGKLEEGMTADLTDFDHILESEGDIKQYARYQVRIDHVGEKECECIVIKRLR